MLNSWILYLEHPSVSSKIGQKSFQIRRKRLAKLAGGGGGGGASASSSEGTSSQVVNIIRRIQDYIY